MISTIKTHWEERLSDGTPEDFKLETSDSFIRCSVNAGETFLAPLQCQHDLEQHIRSRDGRSEISGLIHVARQGGTLFDIGAHAGIVSALFCGFNPANRAYSFEPSPASVERIRAIRALNHLEGRMFVQPYAIGRAKATMEMLVDPAGGYVQTQRFEHSMWSEPQKLEVKVEGIADASERLGVIPDFIKLDIEGYEYEAISGAIDYLARNQPVILLELHLNYLEERKVSAKEIVEMLSGRGYSFFTYAGTPLRPRSLYDSPLQSVRVLARAI